MGVLFASLAIGACSKPPTTPVANEQVTSSTAAVDTTTEAVTMSADEHELSASIISAGANVFSNFEINTINYDFLKWVQENISSQIFDRLNTALADGSYTSSFWFNETDLSLHVLSDWYNGIITDSEALYTNKSDTVTLGFAGDICLSEGWSTLDFYDSHNQDLSAGLSNGIINTTNAFDIFMLNNEFTYSNRGEKLPGKYYTFRAKPERVGIIRELGTDIVSLSNNHVYDYGEDAFYDTLSTLTSNNIPYVGAGKNIEEARKPQFFIINGIKIGYVAANRSEKIIYTPEATDTTPGVLRTYDSAMYVEAIKEAKANCDYLVAYVHWGTEDSNVVADYQKEMGREYIDAGADAVVGGHPHVLQGIEYYNGHPIAYSMGDFWFNDLHDDTGLLNITIDSNGFKEMSFIPCLRADGITSLVTDDTERRRILDYMQDISFGISINDNGVIK